MDWAEWHKRYESVPSLQERLAVVCEEISLAISATRTKPVRILSICSGDGRDVILSTAASKLRKSISGVLIELNPDLVARGRSTIKEFSLQEEISFQCSDATKSETYRSIAPAHIVVLSGVFGNLKYEDVGLLIDSLRSLCEPKARVIWTRNLNEFGDGETVVGGIKKLFANVNFTEASYTKTPSGVFAVGTHVYEGETLNLPARPVLFRFSGFWKVATDA